MTLMDRIKAMRDRQPQGGAVFAAAPAFSAAELRAAREDSLRRHMKASGYSDMKINQYLGQAGKPRLQRAAAA